MNSTTFSKYRLSIFILWLRPAFRSQEMTMYLVLSAFSSSPISLLATTKFSTFSCIVCTLPSNILTSSEITRSWCVPFKVKPSWLTWTLLMTYSKAKLKNNSDRASPFFKPFLIWNMSDKFLPTRTLLYVYTLLLALPFSIGYQTQWEYYTRPPS